MRSISSRHSDTGISLDHYTRNSPKNSHTNLAHCHHHPPLSRWRQQRQQHGNGGDKDVTVTPVTARWWQRDSRAVAEEIARRQRWRDIAAVATWREGDDGGNGPGLSVSFWVSGEMTKNKVRPKQVQYSLEHRPRALSEGNPC